MTKGLVLLGSGVRIGSEWLWRGDSTAIVSKRLTQIAHSISVVMGFDRLSLYTVPCYGITRSYSSAYIDYKKYTRIKGMNNNNMEKEMQSCLASHNGDEFVLIYFAILVKVKFINHRLQLIVL